jgi:hypothetical protein
MHRRHPLALLPLLAMLALTPPAHAQLKLKLPAVPDTPIENLVRVTVPSASLAVVNDSLGLLAFAHHPKYTEAQLTLFRLDPQTGHPGEPVLCKLPKPAALAKYPTYVTGLCFHAKLPLLYVWQDIEFPKDQQRVPLPLAAADVMAVAEFDHLLIYNLEKSPPELVVGLARGPKFAYSRPMGSVAVDQAGERLYVPNIAGDPRNTETLIGSYVLHADGIPVVGEPEEGKEPSEKPSVQTQAAHVAAIQSGKQSGKPVLPQRIAPSGGYAFYADNAVGSGIGFVPVARDVVLTGAFHATGLISWTPEERQCRMQTYQIDSEYNYKLPAGHPTLPLVFVTDMTLTRLYRFEHADGNITLVPQRADIEGSQRLTSFPVVMAKANKIAVGGWTGRIYLIGLNEKGRFKAERQQALVGRNAIEALTYSAKHDRLYVGVEKDKDK